MSSRITCLQVDSAALTVHVFILNILVEQTKCMCSEGSISERDLVSPL